VGHNSRYISQQCISHNKLSDVRVMLGLLVCQGSYGWIIKVKATC